jgi:hypothetical protein
MAPQLLAFITGRTLEWLQTLTQPPLEIPYPTIMISQDSRASAYFQQAS